jgi:hypothetical protein
MHSTALTGAPLRTFQSLYGNAPRHDVEWSAIRTLLKSLGEVTVGPEGNLTTVRNGYVLTLHPGLTKDLTESGEVDALRRFLRESETPPTSGAGRDPHLLLVIHGQDAQLYRCQVLGGVPQLILPYQAEKPNPDQRGNRKSAPTPPPPNSDGFYTRMTEDLQVAGQIVVFGTGGEAATFVAWLAQHDSELSRRIVATVRIDEQHLDLAGLLVAARKFYATLKFPAPASPVTAAA